MCTQSGTAGAYTCTVWHMLHFSSVLLSSCQMCSRTLGGMKLYSELITLVSLLTSVSLHFSHSHSSSVIKTQIHMDSHRSCLTPVLSTAPPPFPSTPSITMEPTARSHFSPQSCGLEKKAFPKWSAACVMTWLSFTLIPSVLFRFPLAWFYCYNKAPKRR